MKSNVIPISIAKQKRWLSWKTWIDTLWRKWLWDKYLDIVCVDDWIVTYNRKIFSILESEEILYDWAEEDEFAIPLNQVIVWKNQVPVEKLSEIALKSVIEFQERAFRAQQQTA